MKTIIDELSLKIDIKTKKDIDKTISSIASAINKLNKAVSNVSALKKYVNTLNSLTRRTFKVSDGASKGKAKETTAIKAPETEEVANINAVSEANKDIVELKKETTKFTQKELEEEKKLSEEKRKQNNEDKKTTKNMSGLTKLMRSFGRIALYRAVRTIISEIVNGTIKGIENIRSIDTELDLSIKKMSQSYMSLNNSFAMLISPLIKLLEPVITHLADAFANIVNSISQANALLSGQTKYTKILTSDSEEYKKNLEDATKQLLDFDKFSVLNREKDAYTGTIEADVQLSSEVEKTRDILTNIYDTIKAIIDVLKSVWDILKPVLLPVFDIIGSVVQQWSAAIQTISGLLKLLSGDFKGFWDNIKNGFADTINGIANMFIGLTNFIINLINTLFIDTNPLFWLLKAVGAVGNDFRIPQIQARVNWQPYADGGMVKRGTYFYAGESGAEIVANTSGGKTGVTNIAQFKTAMVQALAEYGVARNGRTSDTVLQVNGKEFARATANDMASALSQKYRVNFQPR